MPEGAPQVSPSRCVETTAARQLASETDITSFSLLVPYRFLSPLVPMRHRLHTALFIRAFSLRTPVDRRTWPDPHAWADWLVVPVWNVLAQLDGVIMTTSGYSGGKEAAPTYQTVSAGKTGHAESLQVVYDPSKVTYEQLLDVFWHQINPTQVHGEHFFLVTHARSQPSGHCPHRKAHVLAFDLHPWHVERVRLQRR
jgi:hypothetical protein